MILYLPQYTILFNTIYGFRFILAMFIRYNQYICSNFTQHYNVKNNQTQHIIYHTYCPIVQLVFLDCIVVVFFFYLFSFDWASWLYIGLKFNSMSHCFLKVSSKWSKWNKMFAMSVLCVLFTGCKQLSVYLGYKT